MKLFLYLIALLFLSQRLLAHPQGHDQIALLNGKISQQESYSLYAQRAHLNAEAGDYEAALKDLDAAKALGKIEPLLYDYANVYVAQGHLKKALTHYDQFIEFNAKFPQAFQRRGRLLKRLGKIDAAIEDFNTSLNLETLPDPRLYIETADLLLQSTKGNPEAALKLLDQGMKKLNLLGQLQSKAIAIELQHKNYPPAIERMRLLGKEKNFSPFWRVGLAYLLIKAEQNPQAQKELNIASQDLSKMEASPAKNELLHKIQKLQSDLNGTK